MFPLLRKTLLFPPCCSSSSSQVRTFLIRFPVFGFSSPPPTPPPPPPQQPYSRHVEVSVWWDLDNCSVPSGVSFWNVAPSIMAAVRANGIKGKIDIRAYSQFSKVSEVDQCALMSTRICLHQVFPGGTHQAYQHLLMDLNDWVSKHPPPVHLFLISDDRYDSVFSGILHRLRMNNYNILVAYPGRASDILCSAATIMWHWSSMLKREDLIGKHFNYPPDGPCDSWYGDSEVPLENLFSAIEEPTASQNAKIHEPSADIKLGKVPKSVSRKVKKILSSYPNGISIGDLRAELTKCLPLGKHFYDHKSFSNFLVSIPHVQLLYLGDYNFYVHLIPSTTFDAIKKNKQRDGTSTQKLHSECKNADGIPIISSSFVSNLDGDSKSLRSIPSQVVDGKSSFPSFKESNVHQPPNELQKTSLGSETIVDVACSLLPRVQLPPNESDISKNFDNDIVGPEDVSPENLEKKTTSQNPSTCNDYTVLEKNDIPNCESGKEDNKHENPAR